MNKDGIFALYARVSSDKQAKDKTIDSQIAALKEKITADGGTLIEDMMFVDVGVSDATLVRPELERLRDSAAIGAVDRVYFLSPDRLARKYAHQALLLEEFSSAGVSVHFLNHAVGTAPEEELLLQMQGMIAEYERAKIIERHRRGKLHRAKGGSVNVLSTAPYGYTYIRKQLDGEPAQYIVNLQQAKTVRQVFHWIGVERLSIGEMCRRLSEAEIPTQTGKTHWDRSVIWGMLQNPAYMGRAAFGKTKAGKLKPRVRPQKHSAETPKRPYSTHRTDRDTSFGLLGFTHYWGRSRKGRWIVQRKTAKERFTRALREVGRWCQAHRHWPVSAQQAALRRKLQGHYAYYGITGNGRALARFLYEVRRLWRKWLNRRSWHARMTWEKFVRLATRYPLPQPRVVHSVYRRAATP